MRSGSTRNFVALALGSMLTLPQSDGQSTSSAITSASATQSPAASTTTTATATPPPNMLLDGTPVKLRLAETLSSEFAKTGQTVPFEVVEEVTLRGVPVIAKGANALATVTEAQSKRRMGRGGKLDVNVDSARLIDGEKVQLRAVRDGKGGGHVGAMTGAMVATTIVFFPAAPLFLFMKGKDIVIPKGTEVTAFVQGDTRIDLVKMVPPSSVAMPGALAAAEMASLSVDASVSSADIEVDGAFVGSTPSTLSMTPGQHTIVVKKDGYSDWTRTMVVAGSSVRLKADLQAAP